MNYAVFLCYNQIDKIKINGCDKMITVFNRKELLITFDMKRQHEVRDILAANNIDYIIKVANLMSASSFGGRARTGSFGVNQKSSYEYKIYVRKKDYDYALKLIR